MDIFEFAMEKEKASETFYRDLAAKAPHPGLKRILTMLATEESKHYQTVKQMKANTLASLTDTPVLANARAVFEKMRGSADKFNFHITEVDLYRKACDIEKESRDFYLQKAQEVQDPAQKDIFTKLAEQESKHLLLVQRICDFVARPETFLENAEMYRFDDYVDGVF